VNATNVAQTLKGLLSSELMVEVPVGRMDADDSLRDVYGLDSLGFVELRVLCEENFGITISEDDFSPEHFATLGTVVSLVERLMKERENTVQPPG
jgi:acyl carrier protein